VFVALQNSAPVGERFLNGLHTLQNSAFDGEFFSAAHGKSLHHSGSDICSVEF
jgi:hypothetical protein